MASTPISFLSKSQMLGLMIGRTSAETDLTDFYPGSSVLTTMEAATAGDFRIQGQLLRLLTLRDVDKAKGVDLENLGAELGLSPKRIGSAAAAASITIKESAFTKVSSTIYAGANSPVAGDTSLKIVDGTGFNSSGTIYLGRNTKTSEAIPYISISNSGSYWVITLASALSKDHLVGEEVVMAQGGDRKVQAGTIAQVPASGGLPAVQFRTLIDQFMLDGEDTLTGVAAVATAPGSQTVVGTNKISEFSGAPWTTATVFNPNPSAGGRDPETDADLRQRIKNHVHDMSRGTEKAVKGAVIGASDPIQGNRVVSAFLREPTANTEHGVLFIDDGTGLTPTFDSVGEEVIVDSAVGTEQFVQLQQWPVAKCQLQSVGTEPFALQGGEGLYAEVDGTAEERALENTHWRTPGVVLAQEVAETINRTFTTIEARASDGRVFITPTKDDPDYIRVGTSTFTTDAQTAMRFPVRKQYTLRLYDNDVLLEKNGQPALIQSLPNAEWPPLNTSETIQLIVDGIEGPTITLTDSDFASFSTSQTLAGGTVFDWAKVFNKKLIGVTSLAQDDGTFTVQSNLGVNTSAQVGVIGGSLQTKLFGPNAISQGKTSEYSLNRLLGQIELPNRLAAKHQLKAGTTATRGFAESVAQAAFNTSVQSGLPAQLVLVQDQSLELLVVAQNGTLTFTTGTNELIITATAGYFSNVKADDWVHLYQCPRNGLLRVATVASDGSSVTCYDPEPVAGSQTLDGVVHKARFFRTAGRPVLVNLTDGTANLGKDLVTNLNSQLAGALAALTDSGAISVTTNRFESGSALGVASVGGNASNLGITEGSYASTDPHTAAIESADLTGIPTGRILVATPDTTAPYDNLSVTGTPFATAADSNKPLLTYLGSAALAIRQPQSRTDSSDLILRELAPFQSVAIGGDARYTQLSGPEFAQADNMVFIVDGDAATKTFNVPMWVDGVVAGPSVPSQLGFDLLDSVGSDLGNAIATTGQRWAGMNWNDYKIWFQAKADAPCSTPNAGIRITSVPFGPLGGKIKFGLQYPAAAGVNPTIFQAILDQPDTNFELNPTNDEIDITLTLGAGAARSIAFTTGSRIGIATAGTGPYTMTVSFGYPVDFSTVIPGDILSLADSGLNSANQGQFLVTGVNDLADFTKGYQFLTENNTASMTAGAVALSSAPTQTIQTGDQVTFNSISQQISAVTTTTIVVSSGGAYTAAGTITVNGVAVQYTSYSAGTFSGLNLDPVAAGISVGQIAKQAITPVTATITGVTDQQHVTIATGSPADGSGYDTIITHQVVTATAAPSFTAAVGDLLEVNGQFYTITSVISPTIFGISTPFAWTGVKTGILTRLQLICTSATAPVDQTIFASSALAAVVYPLSGSANSASALIQLINSTAGVKDLITASISPGNNGSGKIAKSTEDESGFTHFGLKNTEAYVKATQSASPAFSLKEPTDVAPSVGDPIKLIPATPQNVADHFARKQISGLAIAADVALVNDGRRIQISTKTPGEVGQVYAVGGRASGANVFSLRGTPQEINSTRAIIELDRSALDLLVPGHTIKLSQAGRSRKNWTATAPTATDTIQVDIVSPTVGAITLTKPFVTLYTYTHTGSVQWVVRKLGRSRVRYEVLSGTATLPAGLLVNDWVYVGAGQSYAGTTVPQLFSTANQGWFQILETDNATYFDVEGAGIEEYVTAPTAPFIFTPYHSARPGDQIIVGPDVPVVSANRGTFTITSVPSTTQIQFTNSATVTQSAVALGANGAGEITLLDQGYSTYRKIVVIAPKADDPTNRSQAVIQPGYDVSLLSEGQNAKVFLPNRLGFTTDPVPGMAGYEYWTGLLQTAQRIVDGFEPDSETFEGYRAAGAFIEVRPPQVQRIALTMKIKTLNGVALQSIGDSIKTAISGYINSLGLGQDVVLSELVSAVQNVPGVDSVVLVSPTLDSERITVTANAQAKINDNDITLQ